MRLAILCIFCFCASGQTLRQKAWDAWNAGQKHDPARLESLVGKLREAQPFQDSPKDSEGYDYIESLFDAIIGTPGPVPIDAMLPFQKSWLPEIIIVLTRNPVNIASESALLSLRDQTLPDAEWSAVNDLLYSVGSKPFLQITASELNFSHDLIVADREVLHADDGFAGCTASKRRVPGGFPPIVLYQISTARGLPGLHQTILIEKPIPIYYLAHAVPANGEIEWADCAFHAASIRAFHQRRLSQIISGGVYETLSPRTNIRWHNAKQAGAEMEAALSKQAGLIQDVLAKAGQRGLRFVINPRVEDLRADKKDAIPSVAAREIRIP